MNVDKIPDVSFKPWQKAVAYLSAAGFCTLISGALKTMPLLDAVMYGLGASAIPFVLGYYVAHWLAPTYKSVWGLLVAVVLTIALSILAWVRM